MVINHLIIREKNMDIFSQSTDMLHQSIGLTYYTTCPAISGTNIYNNFMAMSSESFTQKLAKVCIFVQMQINSVRKTRRKFCVKMKKVQPIKLGKIRNSNVNLR